MSSGTVAGDTTRSTSTHSVTVLSLSQFGVWCCVVVDIYNYVFVIGDDA